MHLRPYQPGDRESVLRLNAEAVPAVSLIDATALDDLVGWSESVTVAVTDDGADVAGFLICLGPGMPYRSDNYRWLSERYHSFLYVDRVVVAPSAKGQGLGQALYRRVVANGRHEYPVLVAEVNTRPRNDESLRFHERFGFRPVGEAETASGANRVVYLELALEPGSPT